LQLLIPKSVIALPFPQQLDYVLSSATHAPGATQDAPRCEALPATVPGPRPDHQPSDNALQVRAPNTSRRLSPDPCPSPASACAASAPASHWLAGRPSARVHVKTADAPSV